MMVPLGLWVGIIGYAVLYSGVIKLGGGTCSIADSFRGKCVPKKAGTGGAAQNTTLAGRRQRWAVQQYSALPTTPVAA
jgi:hypothetical protein